LIVNGNAGVFFVHQNLTQKNRTRLLARLVRFCLFATDLARPRYAVIYYKQNAVIYCKQNKVSYVCCPFFEHLLPVL
jgi:hypothetical protein